MTTQADIAQHLGVNARTVRDLISRGAIAKDATVDEARISYMQHLRAVASRYKSESGLDLAGEKAMLTREQRVTAELRNAERRGELVDRTVALHTMGLMVSSARARMRALPAKAVSRIPGFDRVMGVALLGLIDDALASLASDALPPPGAAELCDEDEAA